MPKIEVKESTLNGQAYVIKYVDRQTFYLRVNRGDKRYTNISLGTADVKQAHKNALAAYVKVEGEPPRSKTRKLDISKACEDYLEERAKEVLRGQLAPKVSGPISTADFPAHLALLQGQRHTKHWRH